MHIGSRMGAILKRVPQMDNPFIVWERKQTPLSINNFAPSGVHLGSSSYVVQSEGQLPHLCGAHALLPWFVQTAKCACLPPFRFCLWTDCALQSDFHLSPLRTRMLRHDCFHSWRLLGLVPHTALMSFTPSTRPSWQ